jgi:ABC-type transporter Mla subunit MlaD
MSDEDAQPEAIPEHLQRIAEQYGLPLNDPVLQVMGAHWQRVQESEATLREISLELQSALDARIEILSESGDNLVSVAGQLAQVRTVLEQKPAGYAKRLEEDLKAPIAGAVAQVSALEQSLGNATRTVQAAQRRHTLASFVIGTVFGASLVIWFWPA